MVSQHAFIPSNKGFTRMWFARQKPGSYPPTLPARQQGMSQPLLEESDRMDTSYEE